jgi:hypothetical protein
VGFLSESKGDKFTTDNYKVQSWREVAAVDTQITVSGFNYSPVIRVNYWGYSTTYNQPLTLSGASYYAKDVGLIMTENLRDSVVTLRLIEYYINR